MNNWEILLIITGGTGSFLGSFVWYLSRKIASLQNEMAGNKAEVAHVKQGQDTNKREVDNELDKVRQALRIEQAQAKQYRDDSEKEQNALKGEITALKNQLHDVEEARIADKTANAERIRQLEREIQELRTKLEAAELRAENEKTRADKSETEKAQLQSEKSALQHRLDIIEAELRGRDKEGARVIEVKLIMDKPPIAVEPVPIPPTQDENSPPVVEDIAKEESKETT